VIALVFIVRRPAARLAEVTTTRVRIGSHVDPRIRIARTAAATTTTTTTTTTATTATTTAATGARPGRP
jgi:hypothetical protein